MSSTKEDIPRHTPPQPTEINNSDVPDVLQNRLLLEVINEKPPGENLTGCAAYDVSNYTRLTVLCGDLSSPIKIDVNYLNYLSFTTFKRQDGCTWYMCHTWTRTWGQGAMSGERHDVSSMSLWRGNLQISPDGNLILIEAGIMATSDRQLLVLDISKLPAVDVIHKEYYGCGGTEISNYTFTEDSEFVCTYTYLFQVYKEKIRFNHYFGDDNEQEFKKYVLANCSESEKSHLKDNDYIDRITYFEGGFNVAVDCVVTRKRNENITLMDNWKNDSDTYGLSGGIDNNFFADIKFDDMIITSVVGGEDYEEFSKYMTKGAHDLLHKRCIFCKHRCEDY